MAYDEGLAERIRELVEHRSGISERRMFGGLAFLERGRMFVGVVKSELMVRTGPERYREALARPHVRTMDFTGKPLQGFVFVADEGVADDRSLAEWIHGSLEYVSTLPEKLAWKRPERTSSERAEIRFEARLFRNPGPGGWTFAFVPDELAPPPSHGWGRTPVLAVVDGHEWETSIWRDRKHGTLLAVPKHIRGSKTDGDLVVVTLAPRPATQEPSSADVRERKTSKTATKRKRKPKDR